MAVVRLPCVPLAIFWWQLVVLLLVNEAIAKIGGVAKSQTCFTAL